ncbi:mucin-21-like [Watersipora subatra]|uniref:mucin-21-like n=1 Tax=Watersipora subatra TaxID=2589382 RepID=UPI00355B0950
MVGIKALGCLVIFLSLDLGSSNSTISTEQTLPPSSPSTISSTKLLTQSSSTTVTDSVTQDSTNGTSTTISSGPSSLLTSLLTNASSTEIPTQSSSTAVTNSVTQDSTNGTSTMSNSSSSNLLTSLLTTASTNEPNGTVGIIAGNATNEDISTSSALSLNSTFQMNMTDEVSTSSPIISNITATEAAETTTIGSLNTTTTTPMDSNVAETSRSTTTVASPGSSTAAVCQSPLVISDGSWNPVQDTYSVGSIVTYSCDEGWVISCDTPTATCTSSGTWSVSPCFPRCSGKAGTGNAILNNPYLVPIVAIVCGVVGLGFILLFIGCLAVKCCKGKQKPPKTKSITDMPKTDRKMAGISVYHLGDDLIKVSTDTFKRDESLFAASEDISLEETQQGSSSGSRQTIVTTDLDEKAAEAAVDKNGNS